MAVTTSNGSHISLIMYFVGFAISESGACAEVGSPRPISDLIAIPLRSVRDTRSPSFL